MSQVTIEIDLSEDSAVLTDDRRIFISLGSGVTMKTAAPEWLHRINSCKLQIVLDCEGSPHETDKRTTENSQGA